MQCISGRIFFGEYMENIGNLEVPEVPPPSAELQAIEGQHVIETVEQSSRLRQLGTAALTGTIVGLAAASWVFQVGPWNEAFRVDQATKVLEETLDPNAATLTVAKITAAVELTSASLIALGLNSGNRLTDWFKNKKKGREMLDEVDTSIQESEEREKSKGKSLISKLGSIASDFGLSMAGGAGLVTIKHHRRAEDADSRLAKDIAVGAAATLPVTALSGLVAYTASKIIVTGGEYSWPGSDLVVEYGTSNKFWMGLLAVGYGLKYGIKAIKSRQSNAEDLTQVQAVDADVADIGEQESSVNMFARPAWNEE